MQRRLLPRFHLAAILSTLFITPQVARADFFVHGWENHFENKPFWNFQFDAHYFNTLSNYDATGNITVPAGFTQLNRMEGNIGLEYGLFERLSVFGRVNWLYVSQASSRSGTGFGPGDQTIGVTIRPFGSTTATLRQPKGLLFDLQFQTDIPVYNNQTSENNGTPFLGDSTTDFTGGGFIALPLYASKTNTLSVLAGAGYTVRTASFSMAIPWSLFFQYFPDREGFFVTLGGQGIASLKTDAFGYTPSPRPSLGNGGSFITGATNPTLVQVRGQFGYELNGDSEFYLAGSQTVWGQAAPNGFDIQFSFTSRLGRNSKSHPAFEEPKNYRESNQGFLNYSLDALIIKSNDRLNLVKIDKGGEDGIEVGQTFDVFVRKKNGSAGESVARGQVSDIKPHEAALKITEYYKEVYIDEGFIAKRLIE